MAPALQYLIFCVGGLNAQFQEILVYHDGVRSLPVNSIQDNELTGLSPHTEVG